MSKNVIYSFSSLLLLCIGFNLALYIGCFYDEMFGSPEKAFKKLDSAYHAVRLTYDATARRTLGTLTYWLDDFRDDMLADRAMLIYRFHSDNRRIASKALLWIAGKYFYKSTAENALRILTKNYSDVDDPAYLHLIEFISYTGADSTEFVPLLKALSENSPNKNIRGEAMLGLAVRMKNESPSKAIEILKRVQSEFGDLSVYRLYNGTLGERADQELFELQHLAIGMAAPEIVNRDASGDTFKLSSYKGKVLLIDFNKDLGKDLPANFDVEQELSKTFKGQSFAIVGVGVIDNRRQKEIKREQSIPWRFISDFSYPDGPRAHEADKAPSFGFGQLWKQWNIKCWPTIYILDTKGVIRYKGCLSSSTLHKEGELTEKEIDEGIRRLISETK